MVLQKIIRPFVAKIYVVFVAFQSDWVDDMEVVIHVILVVPSIIINVGHRSFCARKGVVDRPTKP